MKTKTVYGAAFCIEYEDTPESNEIAQFIEKLEKVRMELDRAIKKVDEFGYFHESAWKNLCDSKDKIGSTILFLSEKIDVWRKICPNAYKPPEAYTNTTKKSENLSECFCDFTAHCPVHGTYEYDPDSYIAQP